MFVFFFVFFTVGAPMRMHMPMNSLPLMMDYIPDEDSKSSKTPMTVG